MKMSFLDVSQGHFSELSYQSYLYCPSSGEANYHNHLLHCTYTIYQRTVEKGDSQRRHFLSFLCFLPLCLTCVTAGPILKMFYLKLDISYLVWSYLFSLTVTYNIRWKRPSHNILHAIFGSLILNKYCTFCMISYGLKVVFFNFVVYDKICKYI